MKKTIAKTAALAMAVMLAGTSLPAISASALRVSGAVSATSDESEVAMQEALTKVKKRITVPEELSEFEYGTAQTNGTKEFVFTWGTPEIADKNEYKQLTVRIVGDIITSYTMSDDTLFRSGEPSLAKLSETEILEKAKAYFKQLNPTITGDIRFEISKINLSGRMAGVEFKRYENGIYVNNNRGGVVVDKNTGELINMEIAWYDNADFTSPSGAKTKSEIRDAYRSLCKLTPYYEITSDWEKKKKTARIVYSPSSTAEIDAFTGKFSTIWDDMESADGTTLDYVETYVNAYNDVATYGAGAAFDEGSVEFTEAELKKIQQDNNLITVEKAFEMLKNDKFAAVTDDYEITSYNITSAKNFYDKETFTLEMRLKVKSTAKDFKGYKEMYIKLNAETGEMIYLNKSSYNGGARPALDEDAAKKIADSAAKTYAKKIIGEHKYSSNDSVATTFEKIPTLESMPADTGDDEEILERVTAKNFVYNRYVNGIQVDRDKIEVTVDSNNVVTQYSVDYTEDVKFPSADDILTADQAFDKLFKQLDFDYYYDGWITKDGKVRTYLLYKIDRFYINAKTGRLCSRWGEAVEKNIPTNEVKYTDIKGIPQEKAILEMQKYGVLLTYDSKFEPNEYITGEEFSKFLASAINEYIWLYSKGREREGKGDEVLTRELAAVIFTKAYDREDIYKLKGIFKTPYSDVKSSDENTGAIAIAYAKGFFGKGNGKFNGSKKITRAEAVQLVYDYIKHLSDNQ